MGPDGRRKACAASLLALVWFAAPAAAQARERCPGTQAELTDPRAAESARLCEAASFAESFLGRCEIRPRRPYGIAIDASLCDVVGRPIFGVYRPREGIAFIQPAKGCAAIVSGIPPEDSMAALQRLPPAVVYRSYVVHELAHAIVHQNLKVAPSLPVYEYVSAAAQVAALPDDWRDVYLREFASVDFEPEMFNSLTLAMDPARFGVAAWRHFNRPEHGCAFLRRLLEDDGVFPRLP